MAAPMHGDVKSTWKKVVKSITGESPCTWSSVQLFRRRCSYSPICSTQTQTLRNKKSASNQRRLNSIADYSARIKLSLLSLEGTRCQCRCCKVQGFRCRSVRMTLANNKCNSEQKDQMNLVIRTVFLQSFHPRIHKLFTNFQDLFFLSKFKDQICYTILLAPCIYHVIYTHPSLHSSDAKVLPFHDYNLHQPKYEVV